MMKYADSLVDHVTALCAYGLAPQDIVVKLVLEQGYAAPFARLVVDTIRAGNLHANSVPAAAREAGPEIDTTAQHGVVQLGDAAPAISFEQRVPRIVVLDDFLAPWECETLCADAGALFAPSPLDTASGQPGHQPAIRSSSTANLLPHHSIVVDRIEARIARLTGWPRARGETLQVQKYGAGEQYLPHFDFFYPGCPAEAKALAHGGQRLATLIIYLRQPEAGGATYFANLGMRIAPRRGRALFFSYPDASMAGGTLHGGDPVWMGEKWIVTKWFRQHAWQ